MAELQPSAEATPLGYRRALDGLRGTAVLLVMCGHTELPWLLQGGGAGVDVFFALSGFLITSLILEERARTGRVDLGRFYLRRALRLFPALFVMLGVVGTVAVFSTGPMASSTRRAILPALLYVGNWVAATDVSLGAIGHVWSLCVEEQFYLVWPLLLLSLLPYPDGERRALRAVLVGIVVVVVLTVLAALAGVAGKRLYYGLDTRADALLMGCALALGRNLGVIPRWFSGRRAGIAGVTVLGVIAVAWYPLGRIWFLGGHSVAALASVLVMAHVLSHPTGSINRWLATRWLVSAGRLSYGLYLWHFPIYQLLRAQEFAGRVPLALVLTLGVAAASARYVEAPFMALKKRLTQGSQLLPTVVVPTPSVM